MEEQLKALRAAAMELAAELNDLGVEMGRLKARREAARLELAHVNGQIEGYVAAMRTIVADGEQETAEGPPENEQAHAEA